MGSIFNESGNTYPTIPQMDYRGLYGLILDYYISDKKKPHQIGGVIYVEGTTPRENGDNDNPKPIYGTFITFNKALSSNFLVITFSLFCSIFSLFINLILMKYLIVL